MSRAYSQGVCANTCGGLDRCKCADEVAADPTLTCGTPAPGIPDKACLRGPHADNVHRLSNIQWWMAGDDRVTSDLSTTTPNPHYRETPQPERIPDHAWAASELSRRLMGGAVG